jgi:hypothetical protein
LGQGDAEYEEIAGKEGFAKRRGDAPKEVKIGRGKVPPNGWHFEVVPGLRLEAINEEELVKLIFEYRLRHNIPVGDIERDIDDYYCSRWPKACHKEPKDWVSNPDQVGHVSAEPLLKRVTRWAALMIHGQPKGGYSLINVDEANRRANICVGCPRNQGWRGGCAGCSSSTATVLAQLRKVQSVKQQGNLMGCQVGGWDNATAVWMPATELPLTDDQLKALPDRCWRKV